MLNGHRHMRLFGYLEDQGTSHLSVVDSDRNAVSMTTSVNFYFGSNFASSSTGILFNDVMDDFATPGKSNQYGECSIAIFFLPSSVNTKIICIYPSVKVYTLLKVTTFNPGNGP